MNQYGYSLRMERGDIVVVPTAGPHDVGMQTRLGPLTVTVHQLHKVIPNPDWEVPEHSQPDIELHIIPYGKGMIRVEDTAFEVKSGEWYVTGPGVPHWQKADRDNPMGEYCLAFDLSIREDGVEDERLRAEAEELAAVFRQAYPFALKDVYRMKELFEDIFKEAEHREPGYLLRVQTLIAELLLGVYRSLVRHKDGIYKYASTDKDERSERLALITEFVRRRYMDDITVHDLARELFLSEKQTNRILKREFNQTFKDYLSYHRFMAAKQLVLETGLTTEEIAYKCGLSSADLLYKVFSKFNCPAPTKLRKLEFNS